MWSHTQTEEHEVRVLENRVLEKIFGSTRDKGTGKLEESESCRAS
jgi:hypothetical protein